MKISTLPNQKTFITAALVASLLSPALMSAAVAYDNGYRGQHHGYNHNGNYNGSHSGSQNIYRDGNFGSVAEKLRKSLTRSGYQVMDIQPSEYRSNPSLIVYAKKNNKPYEFKYTYPNLKLISSAQKDWSNVWQDKNRNNRYNNHSNYNHNNYGNNNNVKSKIKNEARYSVIQQRALRKVSDMGYKVKDIELKEKNNRGVFEIDAKRGSQDYEIALGYPNLNVIKLEKD